MLAIIGDQGKLMGQSNGSNGEIGDGKSMAFLPANPGAANRLGWQFPGNRKKTK